VVPAHGRSVAASGTASGGLDASSRPVAAPVGCASTAGPSDLLALSQPVPPDSHAPRWWWPRPDSHAPSGLFSPRSLPHRARGAYLRPLTNTELHLICPLASLSTTGSAQTRRARLLALGRLHVHADLAAFELERSRRGGRLVALTSQWNAPTAPFASEASDWLLLGRETDGLPPDL